ASKGRRGWKLSMWHGISVAFSLVLLFMIVSPILITIWGAITTQSVMGRSSEQGVGWEQITTSSRQADSALAPDSAGIFQSGARRSKGLFTTLWLHYVIEVYVSIIKLSLLLAGLAIAICVVLGVVGGYALVRYNFFGKSLLEEMIMIPLALPGIAVAIALIESYGMLLGSWLIILCGHLLYTVPFMLQS